MPGPPRQVEPDDLAAAGPEVHHDERLARRCVVATGIHGSGCAATQHTVLPTPPRSLLRKMSPKIQNMHMNHAKNRKISNSASGNDPLSLNSNQPSMKPAGEVSAVARFRYPSRVLPGLTPRLSTKDHPLGRARRFRVR